MPASSHTPPSRGGQTSAGIDYTVRGSGPPIVLLHGWCLNRALWSYQEEALRASHTVICPDLPGFGASTGALAPATFSGYGTALDDFLTELGLDGVGVAGFAFGAAVAMLAVAGGSTRIRAMGLVAPPSAAHAPYPRMPKSMRRDWPDFARRSAQAIVTQEHSPATLEWLAHMFRGTSLSVAVDTVGMMATFEPAETAVGLSVKTLLVHGDGDEVVPVSVSEACRDAIDDADLVIIPDSGHLTLIDQPVLTTEALTGFFGRALS